MSFGYATESDDEGSLAGRGSYLTQRFGWQWMAVEQGKSGRTVEAIEQLIATFAYLPLAWSLSIVTVFFWRLRLCIVLLPCLLRTPPDGPPGGKTHPILIREWFLSVKVCPPEYAEIVTGGGRAGRGAESGAGLPRWVPATVGRDTGRRCTTVPCRVRGHLRFAAL